MRVRAFVIVAAVCLAAACSSSHSKKPAAAPSASSASTTASAQAAAAASSPSASTDVNVGVMCSNLDPQIKDLADLVSKLDTGQSVPAMGIGIPIVSASDAAKALILDHPNAAIDPDLSAFAGALDDLDGAVIASTPDPSAVATKVGAVVGAWTMLSRHCGTIGDYAFSNRLG